MSDRVSVEAEGPAERFRDFALVLPEGGFERDYLVGVLVFDGLEPVSVAVAAIAEVGDRLLVAVPGSAWNRRAQRRVLPPGSLVRATAAAVAACTDREEAVAGVELRIWIGFLSPEYEAVASFECYPSFSGRRDFRTLLAMGRSVICNCRGKVFLSERGLSGRHRGGADYRGTTRATGEESGALGGPS